MGGGAGIPETLFELSDSLHLGGLSQHSKSVSVEATSTFCDLQNRQKKRATANAAALL